MRRRELLLIIFSMLFYCAVSAGDKDKKLSNYEFRQKFLNEKVVLNNYSFGEYLNLYQKGNEDRKSPFLAGIFSAIVPGAGEFYCESYLKSGLFLGIEVASWIMNMSYNKKGDDQTALFENYANQNWSVVKYTQWIIKNLEKFVPDKTQRDMIISQNLLYINPDESLKPWQRVSFSNLNTVERIVGGGFSHVLPGYGEQQYFELIGKYPQFRAGWDDADPTDNEVYRNKDSLSAHFKYYSIERGKANDFYSIASTFVSIIVVNHVVSMLDAILSAHLYNKAHINMTFLPMRDYYGKYSYDARLNLTIDF